MNRGHRKLVIILFVMYCEFSINCEIINDKGVNGFIINVYIMSIMGY